MLHPALLFVFSDEIRNVDKFSFQPFTVFIDNVH